MKRWDKPGLNSLNYNRTSYDSKMRAYRHRYICDCCGKAYPERETYDEMLADEVSHQGECSRICMS